MTARPHGLSGRLLEWCSNIILRHASITLQGECFGVSQAANPKPYIKKLKTLKPKTLSPEP